MLQPVPLQGLRGGSGTATGPALTTVKLPRLRHRALQVEVATRRYRRWRVFVLRGAEAVLQVEGGMAR